MLSSSEMAKERTLGDGMDELELTVTESATSIRISNLHRSPSDILRAMKPIQPKTKVHNLVPKFVPKIRKQPKYLTNKPKEPKFVPYEPYKGATEPILRKPLRQFPGPLSENSSKNNVEIQDLVSQLSELKASELNKASLSEPGDVESFISRKEWEKQKKGYEVDIKNLRESNIVLENQLKIQTQVNSELKTLLVAAVGEDLETRVQHLTEDKLHLARALLKSTNHLTSHQEHTEWLTGQCEVWRSKFLASSVMVEELAKWKSALTKRLHDFQEVVKGLLDERGKIQKHAMRTNCNLRVLTKHLDENSSPEVANLKSSSVIDLSSNNFEVSDYICNLKNLQEETLVQKILDQSLKLPQQTKYEKLAFKLLQNPVHISRQQDEIYNALVGAALTGNQPYLQSPSVHISRCSHCTGEIKDI